MEQTSAWRNEASNWGPAVLDWSRINVWISHGLWNFFISQINITMILQLLSWYVFLQGHVIRKMAWQDLPTKHLQKKKTGQTTFISLCTGGRGKLLQHETSMNIWQIISFCSHDLCFWGKVMYYLHTLISLNESCWWCRQSFLDISSSKRQQNITHSYSSWNTKCVQIT